MYNAQPKRLQIKLLISFAQLLLSLAQLSPSFFINLVNYYELHIMYYMRGYVPLLVCKYKMSKITEDS